MNGFSQKVLETISISATQRYYVYALVDPRDKKIFYIGKGEGERVFAHAKGAEFEKDKDDVSKKIDIIQQIQAENKEVEILIIRYALNENTALEIEATLIDLLCFEWFQEFKLTNIQGGHHTFDRGIKTPKELEILYAAEELKDEDFQHSVLAININRTYQRGDDLYEATRKSWVLSKERAENVDFIFAEYRGICRAIYKAERWLKDKKLRNKRQRYLFEGNEVKDEEITKLYLNKKLPAKEQGQANPIQYYNSK